VVNAQKIGRNIRCFGMGDLAPNVPTAEWQVSAGGRRLAAGALSHSHVGSEENAAFRLSKEKGFSSSRMISTAFAVTHFLRRLVRQTVRATQTVPGNALPHARSGS
jgi:hypothetical protein